MILLVGTGTAAARLTSAGVAESSVGLETALNKDRMSFDYEKYVNQTDVKIK